MPTFRERFRNGWNAFINNKDPASEDYADFTEVGVSSYYKPDRIRFSRGNERSVVTSIYNRIAVDVSSIEIMHVRVDENKQFLEEIKSGLDNCLQTTANIDQTGTDLIRDTVISMFDEGCVAVVPVDTDKDPYKTDSYDILSLRTGSILQWYPNRVQVRLYNDRTGKKEDIILPKEDIAIIENPFYSIMNEPNSTLKRLIRKLVLLDTIDNNTGAGKLDLIVQLPYVIQSERRRKQAEARRKDIEMQLSSSQYGIAYTDGTEKVTQLNRPVDNQLMNQVEYLTKLLMSQLGITDEILNGTANEQTMLNYYNRVIDPILSAITEEMRRKFLTKTARTQGQSIMYFRDPFKLVPVNNIADIADKFTRNEILTSNEIRGIIGFRPSNDPSADELRNKNLNQPVDEMPQEYQEYEDDGYEDAMAELDSVDSDLDDLEYELNHSDVLEHYASPYYDPVKAHEYYEAHKQLKGRRSTSGLNDEGQIAAKMVKENLNAEKKGKITKHKGETDQSVEVDKEHTNIRIKSYARQAKNQISNLREELKGMSKEEKAKHSSRIQSIIERIREDNASKKQELNEAHKNKTSSLREEHSEYKTALNEEYENKYDEELEKIASEKRFQKPASSGTRSSSKNSGIVKGGKDHK